MAEYTRLSQIYIDVFRLADNEPMPIIACPECGSRSLYNFEISTAPLTRAQITLITLTMCCTACSELFLLTVPWDGKTTAAELRALLGA